MKTTPQREYAYRGIGNELVRRPTVEATVELFQNRRGELGVRVRCLRTGRLLPRNVSRNSDRDGLICLYGRGAA